MRFRTSSTEYRISPDDPYQAQITAKHRKGQGFVPEHAGDRFRSRSKIKPRLGDMIRFGVYHTGPICEIVEDEDAALKAA